MNYVLYVESGRTRTPATKPTQRGQPESSNRLTVYTVEDLSGGASLVGFLGQELRPVWYRKTTNKNDKKLRV